MDAPARRLAPEEYVLAIFLGVMVLLNFAGIVSRYWLHFSLPWIEEVQVALFVWTVFMGAGLTVVRDIHLGFGSLTERFPMRIQHALAVAGRVLFVVFFGVLGWYGTRMVLGEVANNQRTPTLGAPEWLIGVAIPLGAVVALTRIAGSLARRKTG